MNYLLDEMNRYDTKKAVKISEFCEEMKAQGDFEVYIGTDSQFEAGKINYTTVIAFRFGNNGVRGLYRTLIQYNDNHLLYEKKMKKKTSSRDKKKTYHSDVYQRLRRETELSLETANYVKDILNIKQIDLDYSSKAINLSHNLVSECHGLCEYYGFKASLKGEIQVATPFADKICK
jgi:predicted RNase H-related nuclease YkuK (DUF458 family)